MSIHALKTYFLYHNIYFSQKNYSIQFCVRFIHFNPVFLYEKFLFISILCEKNLFKSILYEKNLFISILYEKKIFNKIFYEKNLITLILYERFIYFNFV